MTPFLRFYIRESLLGLALGIIFAVAVILLNIGHLRHLIQAVEGGLIMGVVFCALNALIFSAAAVAVAVLSAADKPKD